MTKEHVFPQESITYWSIQVQFFAGQGGRISPIRPRPCQRSEDEESLINSLRKNPQLLYWAQCWNKCLFSTDHLILFTPRGSRKRKTKWCYAPDVGFGGASFRLRVQKDLAIEPTFTSVPSDHQLWNALGLKLNRIRGKIWAQKQE